MKLKFISILFFLVILSCKKSDQVVPVVQSNIEPEIVFKDEPAYKSYLDTLYLKFVLTGKQQPNGKPDLGGSIDEGYTAFVRAYWTLQELSSDEALNSWTDVGLVDFQNHSWSSSNQFIRALYERLFFNINYSNLIINQSEDAILDKVGLSTDDRTLVKRYRAEARFLRALCYWIALDEFRNIPLYVTYGATGQKQVSPAEIFSFIETELKAIEEDLPNSRQNGYAKADKACVQTLLAKLYLNAEVYTGEVKYTEALVELNKVLNSGYSLASQYENLFLSDNQNEGSTEIILSLPYDGISAQNWSGTTFLIASPLGEKTMVDNKYLDGSSFPSEQVKTFGLVQAWRGNRPNEALVNKFLGSDSTDKRGIFWKEGRSSAVITDPHNFDGGGYLCTKWKNVTSQGVPGSNSNFADTDFPIFRLADIYLMYAECVLRGGTGGSLSTALTYINQLRERAYGNTNGNITQGELTLDFILEERQRELYWEGTRRTDLIRFGRFAQNYVWPWKGGVQDGIDGSSSVHNIFPIPVIQLNPISNFVQNPGY